MLEREHGAPDPEAPRCPVRTPAARFFTRVPAPHDLLLFIAAGLALNFAPGPDMLLIASTSVGSGQRAGRAAALGIGTGTLVHISLVAFGLAALLAAVPLAYDVLRIAGAVYLVSLGARLLLRRAATAAEPAGRTTSVAAAFRLGIITNVLNPKVALFFLAFLPQFVSPARGSMISQVFLLGLIFDFNGTLVNLLVASVAGHATEWLRRSSRASRALQRLTGAIFLGLGARLALAARR
jgi:threonine/homoserine/homoserine lactone efflux protein